jgi:hypothetical protein
MTPTDLDAAVAKGIITPEQAQALKAESGMAKRESAAPDTGADEEPVSLIDNFGSLFIALGLVILQGAPWLFSAVADGIPLPLLYGGFAVVYWALAEFFVRGPRRLPATVAALLFVYDSFQAVAQGLLDRAGEWNPFAIEDPLAIAIIAGLLVLALARFRLPLLVLVLSLTLVALAFRLFDQPTHWLAAGCGLALLAGGIALDLCDPERKRRWHEWALWLFVVGSPLTIHPMFWTLIHDRVGQEANFGSLIGLVAAVSLAVSFLGLLLDRRSLVVSPLIYLAGAFGYVLLRLAGDPFSLIGLVPLTIGAYVILLGVAWRPVRRAVLERTPLRGLRRWLPRPSP